MRPYQSVLESVNLSNFFKLQPLYQRVKSLPLRL